RRTPRSAVLRQTRSCSITRQERRSRRAGVPERQSRTLRNSRRLTPAPTAGHPPFPLVTALVSASRSVPLVRQNRHMDLMSAPVLDVRPLMPNERCDLLTLLSDLTDEEW